VVECCRQVIKKETKDSIASAVNIIHMKQEGPSSRNWKTASAKSKLLILLWLHRPKLK